ncbi:MAG: ATP-binding protein [Thalassobaculaceae bacterium]|nr:ATP-binding protein [Thalassobaculaceae bacterium]
MIEHPSPFDRVEEQSAWASRGPTIAYAIALILIALLATVVWFTTIHLVSAQGQVAAEINVAGRQRMLTQKIAFLTSTLSTAKTENRSALIAEILACADLMERAHLIMLSRNADAQMATAAEGIDCRPGDTPVLPRGALSDDLRNAYFAAPEPLDDLLVRFLSTVRALTRMPGDAPGDLGRLQDRIFAIAYDDLPRRLDNVAQIIQREGEAQVKQLVQIKTLMWGATLILLALEVLFIFRPMVRRINGTIGALKAMALSLGERQRAELELRLANNAKTRFLAQMSHELRTPLNAIIGYSQMLAAADSLHLSGGKRIEYAEDIKASGEHLLVLVNDLLDLSRIETDTIVVLRDIVDIGRVVGGVAAMIRPQALDRNQKIIVTRPEFQVSARVDERLLRQALINLVDNALKYGRAGGQVRIDFAQRAQDSVEIAVEDDGIGFDMADLPQLMEPFARAESDPTIAPDGVGLGLPLTRRLIELQDGTLTMTSAPGKGTRAVVSVPSVERPFTQLPAAS